jgi:hypothetical protein
VANRCHVRRVSVASIEYRGRITIGLRPQLELAASMSLHPVSNGIEMILAALMALVWLFFFTPDRARVAAGSFDLHLLEFGARDTSSARSAARPASNHRFRG